MTKDHLGEAVFCFVIASYFDTPRPAYPSSYPPSNIPNNPRPRIIRNMGKTEEESRRRLRKGELRDATLAAIGFAGLLLWTAAAPNTLRLLKYIPNNKYRFAYQFRSALARLSQEGLISFAEKNGTRYAKLTERGRARLELLPNQFTTRKKPRRWDGRWRVVMFDIPESQKEVRDALRRRMRELGFYRFQDSAWVFPFDCEDAIELTKADLALGATVQYMVADIWNDRHLRREFSLPFRS